MPVHGTELSQGEALAITRSLITIHYPCIGILGPRQCGKTTLSKLLIDKAGKKAVYLDME